MSRKVGDLCELLTIAKLEPDGYKAWKNSLKDWIAKFSATRIKVNTAKLAANPEEVPSEGGAGSGNAEGVPPEAEPNFATSQTASPQSGEPAGSSMDVEQAAAYARIHGSGTSDEPPKETKIQKQSCQYDEYLQRMFRKMREQLGSEEAPQTANYDRSDAEKHKEYLDNQDQISLEETGPTLNEAWTTSASIKKYHIYARRVVQFFILAANGSGMAVNLAQMRQADIQSILIKYGNYWAEQDGLLAFCL